MNTNVFINSTWENYTQNIPDNSIDLVFTDPPYNVSQKTTLWVDYRKNTGIPGEKRSGDICMDFGEWDYGFSPEKFLKEALRILVPGGSIIVFTSDILLCQYLPLCEGVGFFNKKTIVWEKTNPVPQFRLVNYRNATEFLFWATKGVLKKDNPNWIFLKQEEMKNIFRSPICGGKERLEHSCQKPLFICKEIIKRHCRPGGLVLDLFGGVGSIAMAAYSLGRKFISIEMSEDYHSQAVQRFHNYRVEVEEETDDFEQIKMF